jgi:hypothetical protein
MLGARLFLARHPPQLFSATSRNYASCVSEVARCRHRFANMCHNFSLREQEEPPLEKHTWRRRFRPSATEIFGLFPPPGIVPTKSVSRLTECADDSSVLTRLNNPVTAALDRPHVLRRRDEQTVLIPSRCRFLQKNLGSQTRCTMLPVQL